MSEASRVSGRAQRLRGGEFVVTTELSPLWHGLPGRPGTESGW